MTNELDWIVMKALEKDRTRRYQAASELADDVRNFLADEAVTACPPSLRYRMGKFARRHRTALASSALVTTALMLGTVLSTWQAIRAAGAEADAEGQRQVAANTAKRAEEERDHAVAAREELRRVLYASEMNLLQSSWESNNHRRVAHLLDATRPRNGEVDLRGFEWHYWNRQLYSSVKSTSAVLQQAGKSKPMTSTFSPDGGLMAEQFDGTEFLKTASRVVASVPTARGSWSTIVRTSVINLQFSITKRWILSPCFGGAMSDSRHSVPMVGYWRRQVIRAAYSFGVWRP